MISGIVTDDGVPIIEVEAGGERWQAIIDTGFNGELELLDRLQSQANAKFVGRVHHFWQPIKPSSKMFILLTSYLMVSASAYKRPLLTVRDPGRTGIYGTSTADRFSGPVGDRKRA